MHRWQGQLGPVRVASPFSPWPPEASPFRGVPEVGTVRRPLADPGRGRSRGRDRDRSRGGGFASPAAAATAETAEEDEAMEAVDAAGATEAAAREAAEAAVAEHAAEVVAAASLISCDRAQALARAAASEVGIKRRSFASSLHSRRDRRSFTSSRRVRSHEPK